MLWACLLSKLKQQAGQHMHPQAILHARSQNAQLKQLSDCAASQGSRSAGRYTAAAIRCCDTGSLAAHLRQGHQDEAGRLEEPSRHH